MFGSANGKEPQLLREWFPVMSLLPLPQCELFLSCEMSLTSVRLKVGLRHPGHMSTSHYTSFPATTAASPAPLVPGVILSLRSMSAQSHDKLWCVPEKDRLGLMKNTLRWDKLVQVVDRLVLCNSRFKDLSENLHNCLGNYSYWGGLVCLQV